MNILFYISIILLVMIISTNIQSLIVLDIIIMIIVICVICIKVLLEYNRYKNNEIIVDFKSNRISIDKNRENPPKVQCPKCGEFVYLELEIRPDRPVVIYIGECCNRRIVIPMTDYECMKINDFIIETIDE